MIIIIIRGIFCNSFLFLFCLMIVCSRRGIFEFEDEGRRRRRRKTRNEKNNFALRFFIKKFQFFNFIFLNIPDINMATSAANGPLVSMHYINIPYLVIFYYSSGNRVKK